MYLLWILFLKRARIRIKETNSPLKGLQSGKTCWLQESLPGEGTHNPANGAPDNDPHWWQHGYHRKRAEGPNPSPVLGTLIHWPSPWLFPNPGGRTRHSPVKKAGEMVTDGNSVRNPTIFPSVED